MSTSPPLSPMKLPADLTRRLKALRRRYRLVFAITGLFMLLHAVSILFLFQGIADWWFELPVAARAVFLCADLFVFGLILMRHLPLPLPKKAGLGETSLLVERKWPELRQTIITAVELTEGKSKGTSGSRQLVQILLKQAVEKTAKLDFKQVVPTESFRRWTMLGGVAICGTLIITITSWPSSFTLLERILLFNVPLPSKTHVLPLTRDLTVAVGSDVELSAKITGLVATYGRVTITHSDELPEDLTVNPVPQKPDTFSLTLHSVQKSFKYRFFINDGSSLEFNVTAKVPPAISNLGCTEIYPDYTHLPAQKLPTTDLTLLAGSHLKLEATATTPLKSAKVVLQGVSQEIEMNPDSTRLLWEAEIPIPVTGLTGVSIHLLDQTELNSADDTVYPIDIVLDKPPVLKIVAPVSDFETITLQAKPVIAFEASDDYGIAQLHINYKITKPSGGGSDERHIDIKPSKDGIHYEYVFNVATQMPGAQEGWSIEYWIEAVDNNTVTGPGITKSETKQFSIISPEAKKAELIAQIQQSATDVTNLSAHQQKINQDVGQVLPQR